MPDFLTSQHLLDRLGSKELVELTDDTGLATGQALALALSGALSPQLLNSTLQVNPDPLGDQNLDPSYGKVFDDYLNRGDGMPATDQDDLDAIAVGYGWGYLYTPGAAALTAGTKFTIGAEQFLVTSQMPEGRVKTVGSAGQGDLTLQSAYCYGLVGGDVIQTRGATGWDDGERMVVSLRPDLGNTSPGTDALILRTNRNADGMRVLTLMVNQSLNFRVLDHNGAWIGPLIVTRAQAGTAKAAHATGDRLVVLGLPSQAAQDASTDAATKVQRAVADTVGHFNTYLARRYTLPMAGVPDVLTGKAVAYCRALLHRFQLPASVDAAKKDADSWLKDVAAGRARLLGGENPAPAQKGWSGMATAKRAGVDGVFTDDTLAGY